MEKKRKEPAECLVEKWQAGRGSDKRKDEEQVEEEEGEEEEKEEEEEEEEKVRLNAGSVRRKEAAGPRPLRVSRPLETR